MGRGAPSDVEAAPADRRSSGGVALHPGDRPRPPPPGRQDFQPFRRWLPWLVPTIVAVNIALFIATMYVNDCPKYPSSSCVLRQLGRFSFQPLKENPLLGPSARTLEKMGALEVTRVVHGHQGWRLISCIWLHAGVFHVLANMLSLVFVGLRLEQEFGFVRIGLIYVMSGLGGSLMSALFAQANKNISVGASGALFGLLGSMLSELVTNWTIYSNKVAALLTLVFILAINLAIGILPHVDNLAHIGGFLSGFFLGFVFLIRPQYGWVSSKNASTGYHTSPVKKYKTYQYILWVIAAILLIAGFTVGMILLFHGFNVNDQCSWCHYLSCIPTSLWSCKSQSVSCLVSQTENQFNITCAGSGRSRIYFLPNTTDSAQVQTLCTQFCS